MAQILQLPTRVISSYDALDDLLQRRMVTPEQHWAAVHMRWLDRIRTSPPSGVDAEWTAIRDKEFGDAIDALRIYKCTAAIGSLCRHNQWSPAGINIIRIGLDALAAIFTPSKAWATHPVDCQDPLCACTDRVKNNEIAASGLGVGSGGSKAGDASTRKDEGSTPTVVASVTSPVLKQCKKCPWRVDVDPRDIPDGYCEDLHRGLRTTISDGGVNIGLPMNVMACHESPIGKEKMCAGWFANQVGDGNNIALRLWAIKNKPELVLAGEQHRTFEDTLP